MTVKEFLENPLELNFIMHSNIRRHRALDKLDNSFGPLLSQGVVNSDEYSRVIEEAYPEIKNNQSEVVEEDEISLSELAERAKSRNK